MLQTLSIFSHSSKNIKKNPSNKREKSSDANLSSSLPKLDPKLYTATNSLFLTAKNTSRDFRAPPVSDKSSHLGISFYGKRDNRSDFLDDKILTDKMFLDLNPRKSEKRRSEVSEGGKGTEGGKVKGFKLNKERRRIEEGGYYTGNDSISENYTKSILRGNDKESEIIHCEDENCLRGLKQKFKVKTMFIVQNPKNSNLMNIDRFIERKKLAFMNSLDEEFKGKKQVFLFVDATIFDKDNTKTLLGYCYIDLYVEEDILEKTKITLSRKFYLNHRNIFLYKRNGSPILHFKDIPWSENLMLVYNNPFFKGLPYDDLTKIKLFEQLDKMESILHHSHSNSSFNSLSKFPVLDNLTQSIDMETVIAQGNRQCQAKIIERNKRSSEIMRASGDYIEGLMKGVENPGEFDLSPLVRTRSKKKSIIVSENFEEYERIYKQYKEDLRQMKFDPEEEVENDGTMPVYEKDSCEALQRNFEKIAEKLDKLIKKWRNEPESKKPPEIPDKLWPFYKPKNKNLDKGNFILSNKQKFNSRRRVMQILSQKNREIFIQNIPKLLRQTNFSRSELHSTYILYKVLQDVTSQQSEHYDIRSGLNYDTFRNGIYQIYVQSEIIAEKIFNSIDSTSSGFLNWEKFIRLMGIIKAKTQGEKIDLFIKIADEDGNGTLSNEEIEHLCSVCLSKYINQETDPGFFKGLTQYFTKLIFNAVEVDIEKEIPLQKIKDAIVQGKVESDLLCMFCGADI